MKKVIKRAALIVSFVMICCISYGSSSVLAADFKDMGTKTINDTNKVWTVKFGEPVDINSLNNNIKLQDITNGSTVTVSVSAGTDENSAKINPPSGGYKLSHNYKLTIDKNIKSKKGRHLSQPAVLNFSLVSNSSINTGGNSSNNSGGNSSSNTGGSSSSNTGGSSNNTGGNGSNNNSYTASANVEVSPSVPLRKISVSTNLPNVTKYKIEENNNYFAINSSIITFVSKNTLQVYLYDNSGKLLGTSTLDVSSTKNNIIMNITLAN
ncbi:Ig-like domain-containing protein [Clostridium sp. AWRP]|uniref:Ig-like domain-containing protein n=1 Tax=Clostridium sp. AWRP TaxID=2212991 RepID=UPI000FD97AB1|nr:Ig-like domain-containing protein [Clostridium sp. AWRP]AZV55948.1 hydrolase [Clostridium sp. AWRP]